MFKRKKKPLTPEQIRARTPATEEWVQKCLKLTGLPALDSGNNEYAYGLRRFELQFPRIAKFVIPLFAQRPAAPWWFRVDVHKPR